MSISTSSQVVAHAAVADAASAAATAVDAADASANTAAPPQAAEDRAQYHEAWPYRRSFALRYSVAMAVVAFAFLLRYWTFGAHDHSFPFLFFVPAAMVAAWFGGLGPGLVTMIAGLALGDFFFLSDHQPLGNVRDGERLAMGLYFLTTTLCVMLFEQLHEQIRRLEHRLNQLKKSDDDTSV